MHFTCKKFLLFDSEMQELKQEYLAQGHAKIVIKNITLSIRGAEDQVYHIVNEGLGLQPDVYLSCTLRYFIFYKLLYELEY